MNYYADDISVGDMFVTPNPYYGAGRDCRNLISYDWQATILDCAIDTMTFDTACCFDVEFESDLDWWEIQLVDGHPIDMSDGGPLGLSEFDPDHDCNVPCGNHKIFINTTPRFFTNSDDPNDMPEELVRCYANFGWRQPWSSGYAVTGYVNGVAQGVSSSKWYDLSSIIIHEMGHYLGLPDRDVQCGNLAKGDQCGKYDPSSIMAHLASGQERAREGLDDCCWIRKLYWPDKVPPCPADGVSYGDLFKLDLEQSYPNPSSGGTSIDFSNGRTLPITIEVYDILGRSQLSLANRQIFEPGHHTVLIGPNQLPSGKYIYSLRAEGQVLSREMTIIK